MNEHSNPLAADAAAAGDAVPPSNPSRSRLFHIRLFRKNLARFWPIWSAYLVLWLLLPLTVLSTDWKDNMPVERLSYGLVLAVLFSIASAMAVFSYLYSAKSVHLMHSLPIRREGLFLTNYLSGLSFLILPQLLVFLLTLLAGGYRYPLTLVLWFAAQSLLCLFFYSFAVFCAMFTGNLLALPVFYGIVNFLVGGLLFVITALLREFLFGFNGNTGLDTLAYWFTPIIRFSQELGYHINEDGLYILDGLSILLLYALVGILLAAAVLLIYRRRRLESAGDLVSIRWVRPVFKYGVAFCCAVTLGVWFFSRFRDLFPSGHWSFLIPLLFGGAVGYFAADMLLNKNFRVFARAWRGVLCFSLVLGCAFVVTDMDLFGFNNTPARASVASVRIEGIRTRPNDSGTYPCLNLTDARDIDAVLKLHRAIADNKEAIRTELDADDGSDEKHWRDEVLSDGTSLSVQFYDTTSLYLSYTLTDGRVIRREYLVPLHADALSAPDSIEATLTELMNRPSSVESLYWGHQKISEDARLADVSLDVYPRNSQLSMVSRVSLDSQADRDALLAAVRADMAAGRIGVRYLFDSAERYENCYYNDLVFSFYLPAAANKESASYPVPTDTASDYLPAAESRDWSVSVTLQKTATETLKVLEDLGYASDGQLVTWAEKKRAEDSGTDAEKRETILMQDDKIYAEQRATDAENREAVRIVD